MFRPVLHGVDDILPMLDSHAELERLRGHRHVPPREHFVAVAGRVTDGQHDDRCRDKPRRSRNALQAVGVEYQIFDGGVESHVAAEVFDPLANRFHDGGQAVAAEVRAVVVHDARLARLLPFALGEKFEYPRDIRPRSPAREFAIGERARAAFAEQVIAVRIETATRIERLHIADAVVDFRTAFEHDRLVAMFREKVRRE